MIFTQWYNNLFSVCKQLVLEPKQFWDNNRYLDYFENAVLLFFAPLVLIAGLAAFTGEIISSPEILVSFAALKGLKVIVSYFTQFYIAVFTLTALIKTFGGSRDREMVKILMAYSLAPFVFVSIITGLFPVLYILSIAGLYGFYIFILGAQSRIEVPATNKSRYIILSILLIILIFGMVDTLCWKLLMAFYPYGA